MAAVSWKDFFDRVEVIRYVGYDAIRGAALESELERVGLRGFALDRWTSDSPFLPSLVQSGLRVSGGAGALSELLCGMYAAVRTSLELGASRLLVLEDDVRFARDTSLLERAMAQLPDDFSSLRLSWMARFAGGMDHESLRDARGPWVRLATGLVKDTGAVAFSRSGMEHFAREVEKSLFSNCALGFCDSDRYFESARESGFMYVSLPLLAVQREYPIKMCHKRGYASRYAPFAAPCGYGGSAP